MDVALPAVCFLLGLMLGPLANTAIQRLPAGESILRLWSVCAACEAPIPPRDNIPVLSWLALRRRCRSCGASIGPRYPAVAVASGLLFAAVGARIGADWALPGYLLFAWTLLVVAAIDARTRRIPNRLTHPLTPALLALLALAALVNGEPRAALRSLLGGLAAFTFLYALALVSPGGMGMGDVKLSAFIGVGLGHIGWGHVVLGVSGSFLLGGAIAVVGLATGLRGRGDLMPFAPYVATASMLTVLLGHQVIDAYLQLSGG